MAPLPVARMVVGAVETEQFLLCVGSSGAILRGISFACEPLQYNVMIDNERLTGSKTALKHAGSLAFGWRPFSTPLSMHDSSQSYAFNKGALYSIQGLTTTQGHSWTHCKYIVCVACPCTAFF